MVKANTMTESDQIKTFQAIAEVSRKWVSVLDTKAGFLVAINGALLAFVWTGAKLPDSSLPWVKHLAYIASGLALIALLLAVAVVFPRVKLDTKPSVDSVSFFAYVAGKYGESEGSRFANDVLAMSDRDLAREALEQHHAICHVAMTKNVRVKHAAGFWIGALLFTAGAIFLKAMG